MGTELGRYLDVLDGSFGAAIAAEDDVAADDLALSFLQDLDLTEALRRLGPLEASQGDGVFRPVVELGADYVVIDRPHPSLVPLVHATYRTNPIGCAPRVTSRGMIELLRFLARRCAAVGVSAAGDSWEGTVTRAGRDHLAVMQQGRETIVPVARITAVVLPREETWCF